MKKEIKFRAGKKGQHESLFKIEKLDFDTATEDEMQEYRDNIKLPKELLQSLIEFLGETAKKSEIPKGIALTKDNKTDFDGLAFAISETFQLLKDTESYVTTNQWRLAYESLIYSIPTLLVIQELVNEDQILAGKSRSDGGNKEKIRVKAHKVKLAEPIFNGYLLKNHSKNRASELTAIKLADEYEITVRPETIRSWFKGQK